MPICFFPVDVIGLMKDLPGLFVAEIFGATGPAALFPMLLPLALGGFDSLTSEFRKEALMLVYEA